MMPTLELTDWEARALYGVCLANVFVPSAMAKRERQEPGIGSPVYWNTADLLNQLRSKLEPLVDTYGTQALHDGPAQSRGWRGRNPSAPDQPVPPPVVVVGGRAEEED